MSEKNDNAEAALEQELDEILGAEDDGPDPDDDGGDDTE